MSWLLLQLIRRVKYVVAQVPGLSGYRGHCDKTRKTYAKAIESTAQRLEVLKGSKAIL